MQTVFIPSVRTIVQNVFSGDQQVCSTELVGTGTQHNLVRLVSQLLHPKQNAILARLVQATPQPVTRHIKPLSESMRCSPSVLWMHFRTLKQLELISFGSAAEKGIMLEVSKMGRMIAERRENNLT